MKALGIHHVGVAVDDLDRALDASTSFGGALEHREELADQGVVAAAVMVGRRSRRAACAHRRRHTCGDFLAKRGPGMHHIAYHVDDVAAALADLAADGVELIDETPRRGLFGLEVAFVHPDAVHGVLTEVVSPA